MLTAQQEAALVSGGETTLHSHPHTVTHDQRSRMQQLEKVVFVDADYTAMISDDILFVDTTGGPVDITLPVARGGQHLVVSKITGASVVTLLPSGTDTINSGASLVMSVSNLPVRLKAVDALGYLEI